MRATDAEGDTFYDGILCNALRSAQVAFRCSSLASCRERHNNSKSRSRSVSQSSSFRIRSLADIEKLHRLRQRKSSHPWEKNEERGRQNDTQKGHVRGEEVRSSVDWDTSGYPLTRGPIYLLLPTYSSNNLAIYIILNTVTLLGFQSCQNAAPGILLIDINRERRRPFNALKLPIKVAIRRRRCNLVQIWRRCKPMLVKWSMQWLTGPFIEVAE